MSRRTKATMYPLIKTWESGSQSKTAFCKEQEINIHTFSYWVQKYREEDQQPKQSGENFISLDIDASLPVAGAGLLELSYPNGVRLNFSQLVDIEYLASLIRLPV